ASLMASPAAPVGAPPPFGDSERQYRLWFQICADWLNSLPSALRISSSSERFSSGVPATIWLVVSTYALWCLPWWYSKVSAERCGASASVEYGSSGREKAML